jgi:drug/metabolite transporter (DMT)-like permease
MPVVLGIVGGALTFGAWFYAAKTVQASAAALQETGKAINGPTLQLAGLAALLYAGALVLRETHKS